MKHPRQKPAEDSSQVAKLQVKTVAPIKGLYASPKSLRSKKNVKHVMAKVKPIAQANRLGRAGFQ
jgi:hypothetical protein